MATSFFKVQCSSQVLRFCTRHFHCSWNFLSRQENYEIDLQIDCRNNKKKIRNLEKLYQFKKTATHNLIMLKNFSQFGSFFFVYIMHSISIDQNDQGFHHDVYKYVIAVSFLNFSLFLFYVNYSTLRLLSSLSPSEYYWGWNK